MVSLPALALLALLLLGGAAPVLPRLRRGAAGLQAGTALACLILALGGAVGLAAPAPDLPVPPFGPPWAPLRLALDGLSAWFALWLGILGGCIALHGMAAAGRPASPLEAALLPLALAAILLTLMAADGATLVLGLGLAALALHGLSGRPASLRPVAAALCVAAALGLMAGPAGAGFAALRAGPADGTPAALALGLALLGTVLGLAPGRAAAAGPGLALRAVAAPLLGLYLLARLVLDLGGAAPPPWWGVAPLLLGAALAVAAAWRACHAEEAPALPVEMALAGLGLGVMGIGLAALFRSADLGAGAALAAGGVLALAAAQGLAVLGLALGVAEIGRGTASWRLDRMGGLLRAMPWTGACVLVAVLSAAALPPLAGFAALWALWQAGLDTWRVGGLGLQAPVVLALAAAGLAVGLGAAAMLRLFGLAFLGRPRTPRAAGAADGAWPARAALLLPALGMVALGLLPGPALQAAGAAIEGLVGQDMTGRAGALSVAAGEGARATHAPAVLLALVLLSAGGLRLLARRLGPAELAESPAWDGGFAAPPPHLPFGDPATQPSAAGLAEPMRRLTGPLPRRPDLSGLRLSGLLPPGPGRLARRPLALPAAAMAGLLAWLALFG